MKENTERSVARKKLCVCAHVHVCFEAEPYILGHAASQHLAVPTAKVNLFWSPGLHNRFPSSTMQRQGCRGSSRLAQSSGLRAGIAANDVHTSRATPCRPYPPQPLALPSTITGPGTGPMSCSLPFQTCYSGHHSAPSHSCREPRWQLLGDSADRFGWITQAPSHS